MEEQATREQCVVAGRLEEIGCVAVGGRGRGSQQCQGKPDELPSAKLGERSLQSMLRSRPVGITGGAAGRLETTAWKYLHVGAYLMPSNTTMDVWTLKTCTC